MKISKKANSIESSLTRQLFNMAQKYNDVIDLTLGDPDVIPPKKIRKETCKAVMKGQTRYSANAGLKQLREAVSKHCENGALKYGPHNVDKGIPVSSLFDSGIRHAMKWWLGWKDEPHLVAACWNLLWALNMMLVKPEMDDRPLEDTPDAD